MKLLSVNAQLIQAKQNGTPITTGNLTADKWYKILSKAATGSAFGDGLDVSNIFQAPSTAPMTLATGDSVQLYDLSDEICRTEGEVNMEQELADVTDSCDYPYTVNIPTGVTTISGNLATMVRYDDVTYKLTPITVELFNKFFDVVLDDNTGTYTVTPANNDAMLLFINMNRKVVKAEGVYMTYMIVPITITSLSLSLNGTGADPMAPSAEWTKTEGKAQMYVRLTQPVAA